VEWLVIVFVGLGRQGLVARAAAQELRHGSSNQGVCLGAIAGQAFVNGTTGLWPPATPGCLHDCPPIGRERADAIDVSTVTV